MYVPFTHLRCMHTQSWHKLDVVTQTPLLGYLSLQGMRVMAYAVLTQCLHAGKLKEECTVIVVSHDLREIAPLVDVAWEMQPNGTLSAERDVRHLEYALP